MKNIPKLGIFVVLSLILSTAFMAAQTLAIHHGKEELTANYATIEGVLSIKEGHGHIVVRDANGATKILRVQDDAQIIRNGKPALYSDLRGGDRVKVTFDDHTRVITELHATGT